MREFANKHKQTTGSFGLRHMGCTDLVRRHTEDAKTPTLGVLREIDRGPFGLFGFRTAA